MCGICCVIPFGTKSREIRNAMPKELQDILHSRGPDVSHLITLENKIAFYGFVLWQQGSSPTRQPLETDKHILLFNGDIFRSAKDERMSDTSWLVGQLDKCENEDVMLDLLKTLEGPYSMIIYNKTTECIYFARDPLGRNSLVIECHVDCIRILSSSNRTHYSNIAFELPPLGVFKLSCAPDSNVGEVYPWNDLTEDQKQSLHNVSIRIDIEFRIQRSLDVRWSAHQRRSFVYNFSDVVRDKPQDKNVFEHLLLNREISTAVNQLSVLIQESVKDRVQTSPRFCKNCVKSSLDDVATETVCKHAKVGILFSGGIDCTILAAIADKYVNPEESIDLINVAFEPVKKSSACTDFKVPDRLSAIESLDELKRLFPERQWNLVEVNISRDEMESTMKNHISHLIYPLDTILDESLGCAFWFASRGVGTIDGELYSSSTRVILVGSGADELFGGYVRHRNAFVRCKGSIDEKIQALDDELALDWKRIPTRNLGRDDRVIADNGKTSRAPFIEENLVKFVTQLHPLEICCFDLDQGIGDKLLLRLVGYSLGLRTASLLKKRAIQFGSRIADKNQNAKEISVYLGRKNENK